MRQRKRMAALVLAAGLALGLTACGGRGAEINSFDAKAYVDGLLRETYLGELTPE